MFKNWSESVTVEMIGHQVISEGKSVWHCRKCGDVSGTIYGQSLAGQFLSPKTVKQSSLRIDRDDLVPLRPCSSTTSQNFIHAFSLAMLNANCQALEIFRVPGSEATNCRDGWFSDISRVLI